MEKKYPKKSRKKSKKYPKKIRIFFQIFLDGRSYLLSSQCTFSQVLGAFASWMTLTTFYEFNDNLYRYIRTFYRNWIQGES